MFLALTQDLSENKIAPLNQYNNQISIVNAGRCYLLSNICPHQNARLTNCVTDQLRCPYHGRTFDLQGLGINNSHILEKQETYRNQTILFDQQVSCIFPIDTQFMTLIEHRIDTVDASVDTIMDVFLDIDHIPIAHPGVYDQVGINNIDNVSWSTFENGSIQFVPASSNEHMFKTDRHYNLGAVWMAVYPGTTIEWQPGALFVTVSCASDNGSKVLIYKYKDTRYSQDSYDLNSQVWETAWAQDRELAEGVAVLAVDHLDGLKQQHREWLQNVMRK